MDHGTQRSREDGGVAAERTVRVWEWIAAAHEGDGPVSVAAVGRAAVQRLAVDGASVTAVAGPMAREPLPAPDEGGGPGWMNCSSPWARDPAPLASGSAPRS